MKQKLAAKVIFMMTPEDDICISQCIAFLIDLPSNHNSVMSYMHVGQHSEVSIDFLKDCRLATETEYHDLKSELESIGYCLYLVKTIYGVLIQ